MVTQSRPTPTILLTRPADQSARFAAQLGAAMGAVAIVQSPLLSPEFLPFPPEIPKCAAIILTSETGVEAARRISASGVALPRLAFCVGDTTAKAAAAAGFTARSANGDAIALLDVIQRHDTPGPLLYLRGEDVSSDLAQTLTKSGLVTYSAIIYRQNPQALNAEATKLFAEAEPIILPLFSPRSARLLVAALPEATNAPLWVAALSPKVAMAFADLQPARMAVADHPDVPAMLRAVAALLAEGPVP